MAAIIIRSKLSREERDNTVGLCRRFFRENPKRRVCRIGDDGNHGVWFKVRRNHIEEDVDAYSVPYEPYREQY